MCTVLKVVKKWIFSSFTSPLQFKVPISSNVYKGVIISELSAASDDADTHIELSVIRFKSRVLLIQLKTVIPKAYAFYMMGQPFCLHLDWGFVL